MILQAVFEGRICKAWWDCKGNRLVGEGQVFSVGSLFKKWSPVFNELAQVELELQSNVFIGGGHMGK